MIRTASSACAPRSPLPATSRAPKLFRIAIQPDNYGPDDTSSPVWTRLLQEVGHEVCEVDVYRADILEQLRGCDGLMWRHGHTAAMRQVARRLLPVIETELGLLVYPDQKTCWHYDDKIAQRYLFEAVGIPAPRTWVWFDKNLAKEWARSADYPMVLKLWSGAGSTNVGLVHTFEEAGRWIDRLFGRGVTDLTQESPRRWTRALTRLRVAKRVLLQGAPGHLPAWELHKNYVLFQEFLAGNAYDTRVTVIGDRAFAYRRFNRDNDFRASGSGKIDHNPEGIAPEFVRLAFDVARRLEAQSCAMDGLWRGTEPVVGEVSYTYVSRFVHQCPGHWDPDLHWHPGSMRPEEAQIAGFLARLEARRCAP
jgi:glutathione synthase/RimK-type ligase-like ATP-grasp enzyme